MIRRPDKAAMDEAVRLILAGELVGMPTETVYGLAADAFNAKACAMIFEVKARPSFDPLIVHLAQPDWLERVIAPGLSVETRRVAELLARRFWPGPLTLVLPKADAVPGIVTSGMDTVAVRIPDHPVALALMQALNRPLAAPSANRFGALSPTRAEHVLQGLGPVVPLILDGGPCSIGVESSILDLSRSEPRLLRPGGLSRELLQDALNITLPVEADSTENPLAPGQLKSHYAPATRLTLLGHSVNENEGDENAGLLAFTPLKVRHRYAHVEILSSDGNLAEAAARLFECLHRLDAMKLARIDAEAVPETGLGLAINDRLLKASRAFNSQQHPA